MHITKNILRIILFLFAFTLVFTTVYVVTDILENDMYIEEEIIGSRLQASLTPVSVDDIVMAIRMSGRLPIIDTIPSQHRDAYRIVLPSEDGVLQTGFSPRDLSTIQIPDIVHGNINDNFVGTLVIPDLDISDSLFWTGDDFFLRRDYRGHNSSAGELYIDGRLSKNLLSSDLLINGHNMHNGTKFGNLKRVLRYDHFMPIYMFIKEYPSDRVFIYEIFAAQIIHESETGLHLNFSNDFSRNFYYRNWWRNSLICTPEPNFNNPIVILNTCDSTINGGHLLVFAVMLMWV